MWSGWLGYWTSVLLSQFPYSILLLVKIRTNLVYHYPQLPTTRTTNYCELFGFLLCQPLWPVLILLLCAETTMSTTTHNYLLLGLRTIASSLDSSFANHFDLFDLCEALSRIPVFHNHHHHNIHDYNHHHGFLPGSNTPPYFLQDPRLLDRDHSVLLLFATFRISDQATANRDPTTTARLSLFPALSSF